MLSLLSSLELSEELLSELSSTVGLVLFLLISSVFDLDLQETKVTLNIKTVAINYFSVIIINFLYIRHFSRYFK
ncbi:hypothetical protein CNEO4_640031 [Clostridium neonatale]|nr:hypothetical protein CNEO4_640031 [Clostridium neonatale]